MNEHCRRGSPVTSRCNDWKHSAEVIKDIRMCFLAMKTLSKFFYYTTLATRIGKIYDGNHDSLAPFKFAI